MTLSNPDVEYKELPPIPVEDWPKVIAEARAKFGPQARIGYLDPAPFQDQRPTLGYIRYKGVDYPVHFSWAA